MDKQFPLSLPSVQVTYRIFLRDMLPGWISSIAIAYGLLPKAFQDSPSLIAVSVISLIWSPIIGLLVNTLGYIFLEWILDSRLTRFLFNVLFKTNTEAIETFGKKIVSLTCGENLSDNTKSSMLKELKRRSHFLIRATGWSEKDELVERVHGILQTARSLSFMCFVSVGLFGNKIFTWYGNDIAAWFALLILGFVFLVVACFLTQYATAVDIRLLYELILTGAISPNIIKGELSDPNKEIT